MKDRVKFMYVLPDCIKVVQVSGTQEFYVSSLAVFELRAAEGVLHIFSKM